MTNSQQEPGANSADASQAATAGIDTNVPQSARVYDFLLGGKDNYAADRAVGAALIELVPTLPLHVKANRVFLARAVRASASSSTSVPESQLPTMFTRLRRRSLQKAGCCTSTTTPSSLRTLAR